VLVRAVRQEPALARVLVAPALVQEPLVAPAQEPAARGRALELERALPVLAQELVLEQEPGPEPALVVRVAALAAPARSPGQMTTHAGGKARPPASRSAAVVTALRLIVFLEGCKEQFDIRHSMFVISSGGACRFHPPCAIFHEPYSRPGAVTTDGAASETERLAATAFPSG
jgi:hypothetical protein